MKYTKGSLGKIVHARLDPESEKILERLRRRTGWRDSEIVRRGIRTLSGFAGGSPRKILGLGKFRSGVRDLGSSERHLRGFGRS